MNQSKIKDLTLVSVFIAIIILFATVPMIGFVQIGAVAITTVHIPVILGITLLGTRRGGVILGLTFGLSSLFVALTRASTPVDLLFQNPIVSVLPRLLFGMFVAEAYIQMKKFVKVNAVNVTVVAAVSTFIHTVLVLVPLYYFGLEMFSGTPLTAFISSVVLANGIIEIIAAGLVVPLVFLPVNKFRGE